MGFLSKLFKSDLAQMALPMALGWAMPHMGITGLLGGIQNPMLRSAVEQSLLGYGTAKLTGSKHPEKAAMYAGLGSLPFSFMKANQAASMYNKDMTNLDRDIFKTEKYIKEPGWAATAKQSPFHPAVAAKSPVYDYRIPEANIGAVDNFLAQQKLMQEKPLTAWDILRGKDDRITNIPERRSANVMRDVERQIQNLETHQYEPKIVSRSPWREGDPILPTTEMGMPEVDFYSKVGKGQKNLLGQELTEGKTYTDWLPTIASQTAGWYGGRPTDEELWDDTKKRRRKELAFMYGIPEELMGGELENPYYGGGGFWKDGGIAALEMDAGGAVNGPGGPKDDVIDAKLSDGEFVMTAKAVENFGGGDRMAGAKRMYNMMNQLDPQSETVQESVIGV